MNRKADVYKRQGIVQRVGLKGGVSQFKVELGNILAAYLAHDVRLARDAVLAVVFRHSGGRLFYSGSGSLELVRAFVLAQLCAYYDGGGCQG